MINHTSDNQLLMVAAQAIPGFPLSFRRTLGLRYTVTILGDEVCTRVRSVVSRVSSGHLLDGPDSMRQK